MRLTRSTQATLYLLICSTFGSAQSKPPASPGDRMLAEYFRAETAKLTGACLADIKSLEDWTSRRDEYRRQLLEMLGLDPLPEKSDLKAVVTGKVEQPDFIVEKLHFQSRPGLYVTGNLYLPNKIDKPAPAILYLCGHGPVKKDGVSYGNKVHYQHHGIWFARHGYVCLVIDSLQLGEIEGIHHGTHRYDMWWWNSRGYTPAGVEAWNCLRAIDYLQSRKEVDPERIGATGRSGGGAYSWFITAIDERVKAVVPVAGITDLQNHVVDGTVEGHCDCMFFVNTYRWDYPQVAALVAPRPLLISNTDKDNIFPLDGVLRTHEKVRKIYKLYGAEKNLGLHITEGPHADTQELYTHAFVWFDRFLMGQRRPIDGPAEKRFAPAQLKVFDKLPEDQINMKIHETFVPRTEPKLPATGEGWAKMRDGWLAALRDKVFRGWPKSDLPLEVQRVFLTKVSDETNQTALTAFDFTSQDGVRLRTFVAESRWGEKPGAPVSELHVVVLGEMDWQDFLASQGRFIPREHLGETLPAASDKLYEKLELLEHRTTKEHVKEGRTAVVFVTPRGIGPTRWNASPKNTVQQRRRFMLLGQTLTGMQTWDVLRAIEAVRSQYGPGIASVTIAGHGEMAPVALYSSLFVSNVSQVVLSDPPTSHRERCDLLNVLRYLDMGSAVAMAAERSHVRLRGKPSTEWVVPAEVAEKLRWHAMMGRGVTFAE